MLTLKEGVTNLSVIELTRTGSTSKRLVISSEKIDAKLNKVLPISVAQFKIFSKSRLEDLASSIMY